MAANLSENIALEEETRNCAEQREYVIKEIVDSEERYKCGLETVIDKFLGPLKACAQFSEPILSDADIERVFCNIVDIARLSGQILSNMRTSERIEHVFMKYVKRMSIYSVYTKRYGGALELLGQAGKLLLRVGIGTLL